MKLRREFYKLPVHFDAERLAEEVRGFSEEEWREHPQKYAGNTAMVLISANGGENDDMAGPMQMTDKLRRCPYIQQVLASFNTVFGRSRLMRLAPGADVARHNDVHYYWRNRVRIHVPIITDPAVRFSCADKSVHMAAGEAWIFDNWKPHHVTNPSASHRVHLVADTVGTAPFWNLVREVELKREGQIKSRFVPFDPAAQPELLLERHNHQTVMPPAELSLAIEDLILDLQANRNVDPFLCGNFVRLMDNLRHEWQATWVLHGPGELAWPYFRAVLVRTRKQLSLASKSLLLASTGYPIQDALAAVLKAAFDDRTALSAARVARLPSGTRRVNFDRPVFVIAAPRSGSTLLFETLATNRNLWTLGDESHRQFEGIQALHPRAHDYASNRLTEADATPAIVEELRATFAKDLRNAEGFLYRDMKPGDRPASVRFLEKTPKNALRIPFLRAVFPDALFIYLYRNPRDNISSLLDAWRSGNFVTYTDLPGWSGLPWSHLLIPGWRDLAGRPLAEIVAQQWRETHALILDDLATLPSDRWCTVAYEDFIAHPGDELQRLCRFADLHYGARMQDLGGQPLRPSRYTLTPPDQDKWRKNAAELEIALPLVQDIARKLESLRDSPPQQLAPAS